MKIQINPKECYVIETKESYDLVELRNLVERFKKILSINDINETISKDINNDNENPVDKDPVDNNSDSEELIRRQLKGEIKRIIDKNGKIKKEFIFNDPNNFKEGSLISKIPCPYCNSNKIISNGITKGKFENKRRLRCKDCNKSFYEKYSNKNRSSRRNLSGVIWNRDLAKEILQIHYTPNNKQLKEDFVQKLNQTQKLNYFMDWNKIIKNMTHFKNRYKLKSEEINYRKLKNKSIQSKQY